MKGKVKFFNSGKGFGFIQADDGKDYFVHETALNEGVRLDEGVDVSFDVVDGDRGPKAANVSYADDADDSASEPAEEATEEAAEEPAEEATEEAAEEPAEDAEETTEDSEDEEKKAE